MTQEEIDRLLRKVLSGMASQEEISRLEEWRHATSVHENTFKTMQQVWQERSADPVLADLEAQSQRIWEKALPGGAASPPKRFLDIYVQKIAVAIVFLFILGGMIFWIKDQNKPIAVQEEMIQKTNPAGQKSKLFLPDGSIVWLNSESSLTYPARFADTLRMVKLEGEAFFEVAKHPYKSFVVQSGTVYTTAVGTSFNISAYAGDHHTDIALITGKVKIEQAHQQESVLLEPGEGLQIDHSSQQFHIYQVQKDIALGWKNGILIFDGDHFEEVIQKIQRWYGVTIKMEGKPPSDWKLVGRFENEYLAHVIETIQFGRKFDYKFDDNTLTITFN